MPSFTVEAKRIKSTDRRPWIAFGLAAAWSALIRLPLVLNAQAHLDSDLAVDGLTLLDATKGHWRWHYPGTPFISAWPVLYSFPQAMIWGATPITLVSGGIVAAVGLLLAVFLLGWTTFGPRVAVWSLLPLTFASTGVVWLSGRISGGHLTAAAWQAGAWAIVATCLHRERILSSSLIGLGVWCGLGLALDSMFIVTLAALVILAVVVWSRSDAKGRGWRVAGLFVLGFLAGVWPRALGVWIDPYDAYREQFSVVTDRAVLQDHAGLLVFECLPRLIAGHRLPGLKSDPDPRSFSAPTSVRFRRSFEPLAIVVTGLILAFAAPAVFALLRALMIGSKTSRLVISGLLIATLLTILGFIANRNIFDSDNYRYLVGLLIPWSIGFGLLMDWLARQGRAGRVAAGLGALLLAGVMSADLWQWYARFGWIDDRGRPARNQPLESVLNWLDDHPQVTWIEGGYWDVYRLAFLTSERVRGRPFPIYPNRFPDWKASSGEGRATLIRRTAEGLFHRDQRLKNGDRIVFQGRDVLVLSPP